VDTTVSTSPGPSSTAAPRTTTTTARALTTTSTIAASTTSVAPVVTTVPAPLAVTMNVRDLTQPGRFVVGDQILVTVNISGGSQPIGGAFDVTTTGTTSGLDFCGILWDRSALPGYCVFIYSTPGPAIIRAMFGKGNNADLASATESIDIGAD